MTPLPMCRVCRRYRQGKTCDAYPAERAIPDAIWQGRDLHFDARPGDQGLRYVLDPAAIELASAWVDAGIYPARLLTQRD